MNSSASKDLLFAFALGGLFFGAIFIYAGWRLWSGGRELRRAAVTANAKVLKKTRKSEDRSCGGLENYYVLCAFYDGAGVLREVEIKLPSKLWRQLGDGSTLAITYLPGEVETARAGSRWSWNLRGAVGMIMSVFGIMALVVFPAGALAGWFLSVPQK